MDVAVPKSRDDKFARAIEDSSAARNRDHGPWTDRGNVPVVDYYDSIRNPLGGGSWVHRGASQSEVGAVKRSRREEKQS